MAEARSNFQAVKLASGRVLAVGGRGRDAGALASSELYDPAADAWEQQGAMAYPRASFATVELDDGRVLVAGGNNELGRNLNSSEVSCLDSHRKWIKHIQDKHCALKALEIYR